MIIFSILTLVIVALGNAPFVDSILDKVISPAILKMSSTQCSYKPKLADVFLSTLQNISKRAGEALMKGLLTKDIFTLKEWYKDLLSNKSPEIKLSAQLLHENLWLYCVERFHFLNVETQIHIWNLFIDIFIIESIPFDQSKTIAPLLLSNKEFGGVCCFCLRSLQQISRTFGA
jgi:hypothetical protein